MKVDAKRKAKEVLREYRHAPPPMTDSAAVNYYIDMLQDGELACRHWSEISNEEQKIYKEEVYIWDGEMYHIKEEIEEEN